MQNIPPLSEAFPFLTDCFVDPIVDLFWDPSSLSAHVYDITYLHEDFQSAKLNGRTVGWKEERESERTRRMEMKCFHTRFHPFSRRREKRENCTKCCYGKWVLQQQTLLAKGGKREGFFFLWLKHEFNSIGNPFKWERKRITIFIHCMHLSSERESVWHGVKRTGSDELRVCSSERKAAGKNLSFFPSYRLSLTFLFSVLKCNGIYIFHSFKIWLPGK